MQENELQEILNNMSLADLKELKQLFQHYQKENIVIENMQKRLKDCEEEKNEEQKPTAKEKEIEKNLNIAYSLPKKQKHTLNAILSDKNRISKLTIDNHAFNPNHLDNKNYKKMFFKVKKENITKNYNYLIISLITLIVSGNLLAMGIYVKNTQILILLSLIFCGISIISAFEHINHKKTKLIIAPKEKLSQKDVSDFIKALEKDYEKEQVHSEQMYNSNQVFLSSIEDICKTGITQKEENLIKMASQIRTILNIESSQPLLTEEEIEDMQIAIQKGNQKILKK